VQKRDLDAAHAIIKEDALADARIQLAAEQEAALAERRRILKAEETEALERQRLEAENEKNQYEPHRIFVDT
jgi:hypothetical protein